MPSIPLAFWVPALLLTLLTAVVVVWPLWRRKPDAKARSAEAESYRQQLRELEQDRQEGRIGEAEAEAHYAETGRRLLAALEAGTAQEGMGQDGTGQDGTGQDETGQDGAATPRRAGRQGLSAIVAAFLLFFGAGGLFYLLEGRPDLPDLPHAARSEVPRADLAALVAELQRLTAGIRQNPNDIGQRLRLGEVYEALNRPEDAVNTLGQAFERAPDNPDVAGRYAEALVRAAGGIVTAEAVDIFARIRDSAPQDPRPIYYLALAQAQNGEDQPALESWSDLLATTPADAPWRAAVIARITEAAGRLGLLPETVLAAIPQNSGMDLMDREAATGIAELDPAAQRQAIEGMVAGLAARLEENPDDVEGWLRLGRAREVLGQRQAAEEAYRRGLDHAPDDPETIAELASRLWLSVDQGWPAGLRPAMERLHELDPQAPIALWFLGLAAAEEGATAVARRHWETLLALLPEGVELRSLVADRLSHLPEQTPARD